MTRSRVAAFLCLTALFSCGKEAISFDQILAEIDSRLASGSVSEAGEWIRHGAAVCSGRSNWLSLLKRSYLLGSTADSYEVLFTTSKAALDAISGAEEIAAFYVFAALRTGHFAQAAQYARQHLSSDRWAAIARETDLTRWALTGVPEATYGGEDPLLAAVSSGNPELLSRAGALFKEKRFALDAALLYAHQGRMAEAASEIEEIAGDFPKSATLLMYDAERYEDALRLLDSHDLTFPLLKADLYLRLGEHESATLQYRKYIDDEPNASWIPYVNLSKLHMLEDRGEEAAAIIDAGQALFPGARPLLTSEIELSLAVGDRKRARRLIDEYRDGFSIDKNLALALSRAGPNGADLIRTESFLWEAFLNEPDDSKIARYLAGIIMVSGDVDELGRLLSVWEENNDLTEWSLFLKGYLYVVSGEIDSAREAFSDAWSRNPRWETAYNLGVIAFYGMQYDDAIKYFRQAENSLLSNDRQDDIRRALVRSEIARIHYKNGDYDGALREAQYAAGLDPHCDAALLILKLLESRIE